jgi:membrane protease subunit HflK
MLPLDKLMQQDGAAKPAAAAPPDSQSAAGLRRTRRCRRFDPRNRELMRSRERGVR